MSHLDQVVSTFLREHHDARRPLLLGLSGGPDSRALFHLLKDRVALHVAHIDHGWREESAAEAEELRSTCTGVPFHLTRLAPFDGGNKEDRCREARRAFFREVIETTECQAVVLGHHADDQAETVLKRLLEGAPLVRQGAMREVSTQQGLTLWRPLLSVSKKQIISWLEKRSISYFTDSTNEDPTILRSRMRMEILPQLFGKEVALPLARHADEAAALKGYLDERIAPLLAQREVTPDSWSLDTKGVHPVELEHLIRSAYPLSRQQLHTLTQALLQRLPKQQQGPFEAHMGRLFYHKIG